MQPLSTVARSSAIHTPQTPSNRFTEKYARSWCHGFSAPPWAGLHSAMLEYGTNPWPKTPSSSAFNRGWWCAR